jgi:outer membrane protein
MTMTARMLAAAAVLTVAAGPAYAQDDAPRRTRIALGPQLVPSYPGSDRVSIRPLVDASRARGDAPFVFEAADESAGFALWQRSGYAIGPAIGFQGSRTARDVGAALPRVGFTVELGGFVQYALSDAFRLRAELRQGIGGHKGLIGMIGADYVARDADRWLFSVGPRVTLADDRYHRAYFGVAPADAAAAGLRPFVADGGVQAVGASAGLVHQFTPAWGVIGYAKYDRLVADAARSPVVRTSGSRNQLSGGVALTYTFGGER